MPLVAHLGGELRIFRRRLANQTRFPDVVGERLLAIDVLAVGQRQVGGERVRVLRGRHDDRIEVGLGLSKTRRRSVDLSGLRVSLGRDAPVRPAFTSHKNGDVFVRMRGGGSLSSCGLVRRRPALDRPGVMVSSPRLAFARPPQAMNAISSLLLRFCPRSSAGAPLITASSRDRAADELAARHLTRSRFPVAFLLVDFFIACSSPRCHARLALERATPQAAPVDAVPDARIVIDCRRG